MNGINTIVAFCAVVLVVPVFAQPRMPSSTPVTQQQPPAAPIARMYAMKASGKVPQKLHIDETIKPVAKILEPLPFTTYESLAVTSQEIPWGQEVLFPINALYAFHATALSQQEDGTIALRARVEMLEGQSYVNALDTLAQAVPNHALLFRGMPLGQGELVIVLLVAMPSEQGEQRQSNEEESQNEQEQKDQKTANEQQSPQSEGETPPEQHEQKEDSQEIKDRGEDKPEVGEGEEPERKENLDALLQSLEETDRREQMEERNRRDRIDFKGDWW